MISNPIENPIIAISAKVYRALLVAYPAKFRQEYGSHMLQVFRDCCLRAVHQGGVYGVLKLWLITLLDFIQSVISEHRQKENEMIKKMNSKDIRTAGLALMFGGGLLMLDLYIAVKSSDDLWYLFTSLLAFICTPLIAVGMLGLRSRYGNKTGSIGKNMLLIGAIIGPIISIVGFLFQSVGEFWALIFFGSTILFVCLFLFGLVGIFVRPLPRLNILSLLAGFSLPYLWLPVAFPILESPLNSELSDGSVLVLILIQVLALIALGYILRSDTQDEILSTA